MSVITGFMSDAGLKSFQGRFPRLAFVLDRVATSDSRVMTTAPVYATITDATGALRVDVAPTETMIPRATYTVRATWDAGTGMDVLYGLRVPIGGGALSDLILASRSVEADPIPWGYGPPPEALASGIYYDAVAGMMYGAQSEEVVS
ncbi:hypothetical protein J2Y69_003059 [Microbacterium resistens]|uniref:Uncharacterized protein n=1 Tax=Microbacterium resistens TaxID=156977 RepID=A0ABU1SGP1_9MICO|nr:hypothetical protein [Microbacterium resistens]MDR6868443.1 hypothetical protein [Microbacterium resistens]